MDEGVELTLEQFKDLLKTKTLAIYSYTMLVEDKRIEVDRLFNNDPKSRLLLHNYSIDGFDILVEGDEEQWYIEAERHMDIILNTLESIYMEPSKVELHCKDIRYIGYLID